MMSTMGYVIVIVSVMLGYILHDGRLAILYQPTELLIIGGAAIGALIASSSSYLLKNLMHEVLGALKGSTFQKQKYMELSCCLYELFRIANNNPLHIEKHMENPESSDVFKKYPLVYKDQHILAFISSTLLVKISSNISPYDLEELMDQDIQTIHDGEKVIPATISRMADALPGLGIVAAVLGIVITMGKLSQGKEAIGDSVAAALVGTFLGILLCYGIFQPLASKVETHVEDKGKFYLAIKSGIVAYAKGASPGIAVEYLRRSIPMEHRPSFKELEMATKPEAQPGAA